MVTSIYRKIQDSKPGVFGLLIDPDNYTGQQLSQIITKAEQSRVDLLLLGGSLVFGSIERTLTLIKSLTKIPVVLFPGSSMQFCPLADAILLLSLISGRNPDFLIGNHIHVSKAIKQSGMEVIPTGYMLIESGCITSVQYISNTTPIPSSKHDIAIATALAGQQLGLKAIYLEAGSGADYPVPQKLIEDVRREIELPIIVGGGLNTPEKVNRARLAGANMVVVGNALQNDATLLTRLVEASR